MKKFILFLAGLVASAAFATTTVPVQLINPTGSTLGQTILSTGPTGAPMWGNVPVSTLTGILPITNGGTGSGSANGSTLDNITGFSGTGFLTRTGAGTYAFQSATNGVTLANVAQIAANTVLGNATGSTANVVAFSMPSCSTSASAVIWTTSTGWGCNSTINATYLGGNTAASYAPLASPTFTGTVTIPSGASISGYLTTATAASTYAPLASPTFTGTTTVANLTATGTIHGIGLIGVQSFTAGGTYTADAGTQAVIVEVQSQGGGGGGCPSTTTSQNCAGGSGQAGAYARVYLTSGFSGQTITISNTGAGGAAGSNAGTAGGTSSFGSLISCPGGGNGAAGSANTATTAFINGQASLNGGCTISSGTTLSNTAGATNGPSYSLGVLGLNVSAPGGASMLGKGGYSSGGTGAGSAANSSGGGGSGATSSNGGAAEAGGNPGSAIINVMEFN